ncbi:unnamed protein product, partial [marine sediment metagenome]
LEGLQKLTLTKSTSGQESLAFVGSITRGFFGRRYVYKVEFGPFETGFEIETSIGEVLTTLKPKFPGGDALVNVAPSRKDIYLIVEPDFHNSMETGWRYANVMSFRRFLKILPFKIIPTNDRRIARGRLKALVPERGELVNELRTIFSEIVNAGSKDSFVLATDLRSTDSEGLLQLTPESIPILFTHDPSAIVVWNPGHGDGRHEIRHFTGMSQLDLFKARRDLMTRSSPAGDRGEEKIPKRGIHWGVKLSIGVIIICIFGPILLDMITPPQPAEPPAVTK